MAKREYSKYLYVVQNKEKLIGNDIKIICRSSWEHRMCSFLDLKEDVLKWGYEILTIEYFSPIDKKMHRYYPDFYAEMKEKNNIIKKYIIEVKPDNQTIPPKQPKNNNKKATKRYIYEAYEYVRNQCKWEAAKKFCEKKGYEFKIITENEIFNK